MRTNFQRPVNTKSGRLPNWPPEPTWENVHRLVSGALQWWDRWCPDDGRPAIALKALVHYHEQPTARNRTSLSRAQLALKDARYMALHAIERHPKTGRLLLVSPQGVAHSAACAVYYAIWPVLYPLGDRNSCWIEAMECAGAANVFGFMHYGDLGEDGEDDN